MATWAEAGTLVRIALWVLVVGPALANAFGGFATRVDYFTYIAVGQSVSIDVDAMDMSLVPGCVSAEPNGLTYPELRDSLKAIAERHDIAGFDFVEVNPPLDVGTGVTAYLGALTVIEFLGHICAQPRWAARRSARLAA